MVGREEAQAFVHWAMENVADVLTFDEIMAARENPTPPLPPLPGVIDAAADAAADAGQLPLDDVAPIDSAAVKAILKDIEASVD